MQPLVFEGVSYFHFDSWLLEYLLKQPGYEALLPA